MLLLAAVTWVFAIRLCGWIYACGCLNLWEGGAAQCNIHAAHLKHCPICELPTYAYNTLLLSIMAAQGWLIRRDSWLGAALAFPILMVGVSLVLGWYVGYWSGESIADH